MWVNVETHHHSRLVSCLGDQGLLFARRKMRMAKPPFKGVVPGVIEPRGSLLQRVHHFLRGRHAQRVYFVCRTELTKVDAEPYGRTFGVEFLSSKLYSKGLPSQPTQLLAEVPSGRDPSCGQIVSRK